MDVVSARELGWVGCRNARDVGGMPARDGRRTRAGTLLRTDTLTRLEPEGREAFEALAVGRIIDLRSPGEMDGRPHPYADGEVYVQIPWNDAAREKDRVPGSERTQADRYRGSLERNTAQVAAVVTAVATSPAGLPVVVHCVDGKDRTGLLVGLLLDLVGVPRELIAADYALSAERLEVERRLAAHDGTAAERAEAEVGWRTPPEAMLRALEHLDSAHGGTRAYLLRSGVSAADLDRLLERLLTD
jgi:protein tyrosine/serine phosphatase